MSQLVFFQTIEEYRELFKKIFLDQEMFTYDGVKVVFQEGHFNHMFFRQKSTNKPKFDTKTAQAILMIKNIICNELSGVEVYEQLNYKRRERSHIFLYNGLYVILGFNSSGNFFYPITAYHKSKGDVQKFKEHMYLYQIL